ncbi:MAG: hypothetical protein A2189_02270 [Paenibacillus sp. RIFOXYA1_FULL_44_5]|nr:MAG: hypothetical protein A2189_02270 [Paenibacillus sp. RIFOXYA1_FULL_44_5]
MVVANDVSEEGAGFYVDTNIIHIFDKDGKSVSLPKMSKKHVAEQLWRFIIQRLKDEGRL